MQLRISLHNMCVIMLMHTITVFRLVTDIPYNRLETKRATCRFEKHGFEEMPDVKSFVG